MSADQEILILLWKAKGVGKNVIMGDSKISPFQDIPKKGGDSKISPKR